MRSRGIRHCEVRGNYAQSPYRTKIGPGPKGKSGLVPLLYSCHACRHSVVVAPGIQLIGCARIGRDVQLVPRRPTNRLGHLVMRQVTILRAASLTGSADWRCGRPVNHGYRGGWPPAFMRATFTSFRKIASGQPSTQIYPPRNPWAGRLLPLTPTADPWSGRLLPTPTPKADPLAPDTMTSGGNPIFRRLNHPRPPCWLPWPPIDRYQ